MIPPWQPVLDGSGYASFHRRVTRWNLARIIVPVVAVVVLAGAGATSYFVVSYLHEGAGAVTGVVTESSRPLDGVAKAPVDLTGDGVADDWAVGEHLPGETVTMLVNASGDIIPDRTGGDVAVMLFFGILSTLIVSTFVGLGTYFAFEKWGYSAAYRDWDDALRILETHPSWQRGR